jgi:hypothetical protein
LGAPTFKRVCPPPPPPPPPPTHTRRDAHQSLALVPHGSDRSFRNEGLATTLLVARWKVSPTSSAVRPSSLLVVVVVGRDFVRGRGRGQAQGRDLPLAFEKDKKRLEVDALLLLICVSLFGPSHRLVD